MFELTPFARNNHFPGYYDPFKAMEEFEKNFSDIRFLPSRPVFARPRTHTFLTLLVLLVVTQ